MGELEEKAELKVGDTRLSSCFRVGFSRFDFSELAAPNYFASCFFRVALSGLRYLSWLNDLVSLVVVSSCFAVLDFSIGIIPGCCFRAGFFPVTGFKLADFDPGDLNSRILNSRI